MTVTVIFPVSLVSPSYVNLYFKIYVPAVSIIPDDTSMLGEILLTRQLLVLLVTFVEPL